MVLAHSSEWFARAVCSFAIRSAKCAMNDDAWFIDSLAIIWFSGGRLTKFSYANQRPSIRLWINERCSRQQLRWFQVRSFEAECKDAHCSLQSPMWTLQLHSELQGILTAIFLSRQECVWRKEQTNRSIMRKQCFRMNFIHELALFRSEKINLSRSDFASNWSCLENWLMKSNPPKSHRTIISWNCT